MLVLPFQVTHELLSQLVLALWTLALQNYISRYRPLYVSSYWRYVQNNVFDLSVTLPPLT